MMKRGFTIIELLVASLLLGMLVSILTMIFNQSSVAWRTGVAGVADLDLVRQNVAEIREEADNAYVWNNRMQRLLGVWDENGDLRKRAWNVDTEAGETVASTKYLESKLSVPKRLEDFKIIGVGNGDAGGSLKTYTVNVKSAGPDKEFGTWDDIRSFPDEFE